MNCPFCADTPLQVVNTVAGTLERCPSCQGLFIPWDMLAAFSSEPDTFRASIQKARSLLFPTGRICPHCLGRLSQGWLPGYEGILTFCISCQRLWTDAIELSRLDSQVAWGLERQLQTPNEPITTSTPPRADGSSATGVQGLGSDAFERMLQEKQAEWQKRYETLEIELKARHEQELITARDTTTKSYEAQLVALQQTLADLHKKRTDQESELKALKERLDAESGKKHSAEAEKAIQEKIVAVKREHAQEIEALQTHIQELKTKLESAEKRAEPPTPIEPPKPMPAESKPTPVPKPVEPPKPLPELAKPIAKPEPAKPQPGPKPVVPKEKKPSFFEEVFKPFKDAWSGTTIPKPTAKKPEPAKPAPKPDPLPVQKPVEQPKPAPIATPKPVEPPKPAPKPEPVPEPIKQKPLSEPAKPKAVPEPVKPEPTPTPVPAPVPKPVPPPAVKPQPTPMPKKPVEAKPFHLRAMIAAWLPRILPWIAFLISYGIDEDAGWAMLWAIMIWSAALVIRLKWLYPSLKGAASSTIEEAHLKMKSSKGRGIPIQLQGMLVDGASKILVFRDSTGEIRLNKLGPLEVFPRLFGLTNAGQFPKEEFVLKGWYRLSTIPFVEVQEVRTEKTARTSLVKPLRWTTDLLVLAFSILLLVLAS